MALYKGFKKVVHYRHPNGYWISKSKAQKIGFGRGKAWKEEYYVEPSRTGQKKVSRERLVEKGIRPRRPTIRDLEREAKKKFTAHQKEALRDMQAMSEEDLEDIMSRGTCPRLKSYVKWLRDEGWLD